MKPSKQRHRWDDSESAPAAVTARVPVQTTFRNIPGSPAVAARVEAETQKLHRYFAHITRCRVVIVAPHRHQQHGRHYEVHLELAVPGERIVIDHEPAARVRPDARRLTKKDARQASHRDIYVVIREVFDAARRRLEDYARRTRGDVKRHQPTR